MEQDKNKVAYNLVMIRHGQSEWNKLNRFTGWTDIDLTSKGIKEAKLAGQLLRKIQFNYDIAFTSVLKRAIRTLWIILDKMDRMETPVIKSWRLNERHYGELTGLNKLKMIEKYGAKQVQIWRRSYNTKPPIFNQNKNMTHHPPLKNIKDSTEASDLSKKLLLGESLKDTKTRVLGIWNKAIAPALKDKAKVLIVAHGNTLRALIKHIEVLSDHEVVNVETPTGVPIAYGLSTTDLAIKTPRTVIT